MNSALQLQPSIFTAFPTRHGQQLRQILCQLPSSFLSIISELFHESSHLAHSKALTALLIPFIINSLHTLVSFCAVYFLLNHVFSSKSELFAKKWGGGVPPACRFLPGVLPREYYFSR